MARHNSKPLSTSRAQIVPEWSEYYVNAQGISRIIEAISTFDERLDPLHERYRSPMSGEEKWLVGELSELFKNELVSELFKVNWFFKYQFNNRLKVTLVKLQRNLQELDSLEQLPSSAQNRAKLREFRIVLKNSFKTHYKELWGIAEFQKTNLEIMNALLSQYRIRFGLHDCFDPALVKDFNSQLQKSFLFMKEVETNSALYFMRISYISRVSGSNQERAAQELGMIAMGEQFGVKKAIVIGGLGGAMLVLMIVCLVFLSMLGFFKNAESPFVTKVFPMFRGSLVLFLYVLFFGIEVFIWENYHVNYRRVLGIQLKYSSAEKIILRAEFFLVIWGFCLLYATESFYDILDSSFLNMEAAAYVACVPNLLFILYMLWPVPGMLNFGGRLWLARSFWDILKALYVTPAFVLTFITDQASSFTIYFRDLCYMLCFFSNFIQNGDQLSEIRCSSSTPFIVFDIFFVLVIFVVRIWFCVNLAIRTKDPVDRKFHLINACKFLTALNTNIWGVVLRYANWAEPVWWASVVVSTLSFFTWDILRDFALFQRGSKNFPLRENMAYPRWFYFFATFLNLFLRLAWAIQMSPISAFKTPIEKNVVTTISGIIEAFRRCLWNLFKIEVEHLKMAGSFDMIQNVPWPINYPELKFQTHRKVVNGEYKNIINKVKMSEDELVRRETIARGEGDDFFDLNYSADEDEILEAREKYNQRLKDLEKQLYEDLKTFEKQVAPSNSNRTESSLPNRSHVSAAEAGTPSDRRKLSGFNFPSYPELFQIANKFAPESPTVPATQPPQPPPQLPASPDPFVTSQTELRPSDFGKIDPMRFNQNSLRRLGTPRISEFRDPGRASVSSRFSISKPLERPINKPSAPNVPYVETATLVYAGTAYQSNAAPSETPAERPEGSKPTRVTL